MGFENGLFAVTGLSQTPYATAGSIREVIKSAFTSAGLPAFAPHSFRKTIVKWGVGHYRTPEALKAFSQNIGHEHLMTTYSAYLPVSQERQAELITRQQ
jgi:integrase